MRATDKVRALHKIVELALQTYPRELHRYLLRRWRDPQGVKELAQELHMRLVRMDAELPLPDEPLAYLYTMASNVIAERTEAEANRDWVEFDSETIEDWASDPNNALPDDMAERLDLERTLEGALQQLSSKQREVLLLRYQHGFSIQEIAERTGLSVTSVDKYITRGKTRMRQLLWTA